MSVGRLCGDSLGFGRSRLGRAEGGGALRARQRNRDPRTMAGLKRLPGAFTGARGFLSASRWAMTPWIFSGGHRCLGWTACMSLVCCTTSVPHAAPSTDGSPGPASLGPTSSAVAQPRGRQSAQPPAAAGSTARPAAEDPLTGSAISVQEAAGSCSSVVVARIVQRGTPNPDAPMQAYYDGARAQVVRTLLGARIDGTIDLTYTVQGSLSNRDSESAPQEGDEYILFLRGPQSGRYRAIKMLRPTAENLSAVAAR